MLYKPADLVAIAVGGVAGAAARYLIVEDSPADGGWFEYAPNSSLTYAFDPGIPMRTIIVNVVGCMLLGVFTFLLSRSVSTANRRVLVAAATGFCGSLTTFSTFATDAANLLRNDAGVGKGLAYLLISIVAGALAFLAGRWAARVASR